MRCISLLLATSPYAFGVRPAISSINSNNACHLFMNCPLLYYKPWPSLKNKNYITKLYNKFCTTNCILIYTYLQVNFINKLLIHNYFPRHKNGLTFNRRKEQICCFLTYYLNKCSLLEFKYVATLLVIRGWHTIIKRALKKTVIFYQFKRYEKIIQHKTYYNVWLICVRYL